MKNCFYNCLKLKRIVYSLVLAFILGIGCENDKQNEKFFNIESIDLLNLESIEGFWEEDSEIDTSYYMGAGFESDSGFIDGIRLYSEDRGIRISVFRMRSIAINAMEMRIGTVACVIEEGTSEVVNGTWWYSKCIPHMVFVSQWNTIIEVYYYHTEFESVEGILYNTANEIASRVDHHSY